MSNLPCEGNACEGMRRKFSGRSVVLQNSGGDTVSGTIIWGSALGTCNNGDYFTLFPGETGTYAFPHSWIISSCKIIANKD